MAELDNQKTLDQVIAAIKKELSAKEVTVAGRGLEFFVFRAETQAGPVAVKVPLDRIYSNANDSYIDSRVLLRQELAIMEHLRAHGIAELPDPLGLIGVAGFSAAVMSFVPTDDSLADEYHLGQLMAKIHNAPLPTFELRAQEGQEISTLVSSRVGERWKNLSNAIEGLPGLPSVDSLATSLSHTQDTRHLLHMDFRHANFRALNGKLLAVVDWSNALVGHPSLELARTAETGEMGQRFLEGYSSIAKLPEVDRLTETLFRLDTAVMLALVFVLEAPSPERAPGAIRRVRELHGALMEDLDM